MTQPSAADELPKQYDHEQAQSRWYGFWESHGYFAADPDPRPPGDPQRRKPFTIVIPPPNVTGALHLGHALNNTLQDIVIRFKRMQGFNTLWMPGTDHAGIATQAVVERRLLEEEKKSRHDLGREALVERIWAWKEQYEARILGQLKQMGCSCDWRRTRFTLDAVCARAVRHTFFKMFKDNLIYRGKRLVNWDTFLQTAVSDDELFHETVKGHFWHLRYPLIDPQPGEPTHVTVATTRPETMLGDTAVAVHPDPETALDEAQREFEEKLSAAAAKDRAEIEAQLDDLRERRRTLLPNLLKLRDMARDGRKLMLPLLNRPIPLVADEWAKPQLGSGCVKITPAHDPNDYEVGRRRGLPMINILNTDGTLNAAAGPYQGLTVKKARARVVADLEAAGLLNPEETENREIDLAHSDRSKTPIEPYLADQWFVRMEQLSQSAMDAVTDGRVRIVPERYGKGYLDWLAEKRDWPVSRQLWWGHRIPIWYAPTASLAEIERAFAGRGDVAWQRDEEHNQWLVCAEEEDLREDAIPGHNISQDSDVLDTWFSSALWPFSTLGWPEKTPELAYYYPTNLLITSRDIITLWVARMVLMGLYDVGEVPFREVYIHPKILDGYGETMSKTKGNGVDPLDIINKFGTDALRFALAHMATETQDVRMPVEFECPHCHKTIEQTQKNRVLPRIQCPHCKADFSTQWAAKPEDAALPRAAVVSERFELARNFCNKLWNAARFALLNLADYSPGRVDEADLKLEDRWVLSRLATVTDQITRAIESYHFAEAARFIYDFAWDEFCSFYVEMLKPRLADAGLRPTAQRILAHVLDTIARLLHPIAPFITEEIWQRLAEAVPQRGVPEPAAASESAMIAPWPKADLKMQNADIELRFAKFQAVLAGLREVRSRNNIDAKREVTFFAESDEVTTNVVLPMAVQFKAMAGAAEVGRGQFEPHPALTDRFTAAGCDFVVDLRGHIDIKAKIQQLRQRYDQLGQYHAAKIKKLSDEQFRRRAPPKVVASEEESRDELQRQRLSLISDIEDLELQLHGDDSPPDSD